MLRVVGDAHGQLGEHRTMGLEACAPHVATHMASRCRGVAPRPFRESQGGCTPALAAQLQGGEDNGTQMIARVSWWL